MSCAPRRALARLAAGPALAGLLLLSTATAAAAHDELIGSAPAADAALDVAPDHVRLDYNADVLTFGAAVVVADRSGGTWQTGEPVMDGPSVTVPLDPAMPDGAYEVRWRVVSSDGHPITGLVPFTVGDVVPAPDPTTPASGSAAPAGAADTADPADAATGTEVSAPAAASPWRTVAVAAGGAVLALGLYLLVGLVRRRRAATS
ncbi:copper resistance CopC family protein [Cellulomonas triticagri]|uniref:Copper resistance protein CopC n=1 Tax=Cellulomonas triticagri TaxID=2483352 RepID=A0A3M2J094_9CELL|nr:copper resistance CopC family protein [Cellulomonas triticagri]RMI04883.1 copper resistance protein CopC [Cellulomonas triticagri]